MKNIYINFITNTIVVTKNFYKAATEYNTEEYLVLKKVKAENPTMEVSVRVASKKRKPNENKGLTYTYMRDFIRVMDSDNLVTFEELIAYYKSLDYEGASLYNCVKEWFLETYPRHRDMIVEAAPKAA